MSGADAGGFVVEATVSIARPPAEVVRWLVEPERLRQWLLAVDRLETVSGEPGTGQGPRFRIALGSGRRFAGSFLGDLVEQTETRVVRRYVADGMQLPSTAYARTVTYLLHPTGGGTALTCHVATEIPGLSRSAARMSAGSERKSVERSLGRLRSLAESGSLGTWQRWRDSNVSPTPL